MDALGSVRQLADAQGQIVLTQSYSPFGVVLAQEGTAESGFGFTSEQTDLTGLVFLRARYYSPRVGRFVSKDPWPGTVGEPKTLHGWVYVGNNPVNAVDPSGYQGPVAGVLPWVVGPIILTAPAWAPWAVAAGLIVANLVVLERPDMPPPVVLPQPRPVAPRIGWDSPEARRTSAPDWTQEAPLAPQNLPTPEPQPAPTIDIVPPCPPTETPRPGEHKVLTVGDGDFGYSKSLARGRATWRITGTSYGDGSNNQMLVGSVGNLTLYTDVDARQLESGAVTGRNQYDAIVFNNPYDGPDGKRTASLIQGFRQSARRVLAPGGEIHINVTQELLRRVEGVAPALGLPSDISTSMIKSLPTFGQTKYYAPFVPHYSTGAAMGHYRRDPALVAGLKNFVFR